MEMNWQLLGGLVLFLGICYGVYKYVYLPNKERREKQRAEGIRKFPKDYPGEADPK